MKKNFLLILVVGALIFQGCAAWQSALQKNIVEGRTGGWKELEEVKITKDFSEGEKPYKITKKSETLPAEAEVKKEKYTEKREIAYDSQIIPDVNLSKYPPLKTTQRLNMRQIRQRITESGLEPHFISQSHLVRNRAPNGKMVIQRAENVLYLGRWNIQDSTSKKIFTPVEIAECGNSADGFKEVTTPAKQVERYHDKEVIKVTERYRDTVTVTVTKKILPPPPKKEEREKPIDYGGGDSGGGGGACGGGSGPSR